MAKGAAVATDYEEIALHHLADARALSKAPSNAAQAEVQALIGIGYALLAIRDSLEKARL